MNDTPRTPGTIVWHDLTVAAAPAVAAFYRDVLGVSLDPVPMGGYDDYNVLPEPGAPPVAGVCHARGRNANLPPVWLAYFVVDDLPRSLAACNAGGGSVIAGPTRAGDGAYAVVEDPAGAAFALWADGGHDADALEESGGLEEGGSLEASGGDADRDGRESAWMWASDRDPAALIEEIVLAGLLVASGGEGRVDGSELRTIMDCVKSRFRTVGANLRLEALARAVERFSTASVADVSESVARLGQGLPPAGRSAVWADLCAVAAADGAVHTMEQTLLRHIAAAWDLTPGTDAPPETAVPGADAGSEGGALSEGASEPSEEEASELRH